MHSFERLSDVMRRLSIPRPPAFRDDTFERNLSPLKPKPDRSGWPGTLAEPDMN